ncbi:ankyrin repeat-containing domain protein [Mycena polygramma]|nr:ankyrin repeat-containing domain protein [Mycena polygramma]
MADPLSIVQGVFELGMAIKESIEKVTDNKENLADLKKEVLDTVEGLKSLAQGYGDTEATGELQTALENLTDQLEVINNRCQALTQSKGIPAFVKAWFKREKIATEIKKLKDNRTNCYTQFQLLSLVRVEGTSAQMEEHAAQIKVTTARTEETVVRTETNTIQLISLARKKELQEWFQAIDMREKQCATYALRHNDTGKWVLEGTEFAKWKEEPGCLWIRGNSGTGKSVLSSIAIDHLFDYRPVKVTNSHPATPNFGIAYFYFDFRDEKKQLLENMLRAIIMQLSEQSPTPYSVLDLHFQSCQGGIFPTHDDLLVMLNTILAEFTGTYIVLDALDECDEHNKLVQFLTTLCGWVKPVHLFVASQPRSVFMESPAFVGASVIVLEPDATHADIMQFVASELELNSKLKHIRKAKDAAPKIVDKSHGMFRMAACLLQELARKRIDTNIDKILAKLPNDLFGIYTRFLQSIDEDDFVHVATLLRWLAFSAEPVTLRELDEALAIQFPEPDRWVFEPENRGRVENVCGLLEGLVAVEDLLSTQYSPEVTLAHSSVADYITSKRFLDEYTHDLREAPSHTFLAQSCVTYLLHSGTNFLYAYTLRQYPLAPYAAKFWSHHLLRCHDRSVLRGSIMHLLKSGSQQYAVSNFLYDRYIRHNPDWSQFAMPPLHLCSKIGYVEGVRFLCENGADVNTVGAGNSALQYAVWNGHVDVVRFLLENGAEVSTVGGEDLQLAAQDGYADIVRLLLEQNAAGEDVGSALQAAAREGHVSTVGVLLDHGADVNGVGEFGSALQCAASAGHVDVVRILLDRGADMNAVGNSQYSGALQGAAQSGHADVVHILLQKGADVNAKDGRHSTALGAAASHGHLDILRLLLQNGADVNALDRHGTALEAAASSGHLDILRLLLQNGADVNALNGRHGTALKAAASSGHLDILRLLLDHGAEVNLVDLLRNSALQSAARNGHVDLVRVLLKHGAEVNTAGGSNGSALQGAARNGCVDVVRILLEHNAEVNAVHKYSGSALHAAAKNGKVDVVRVLLDGGADVNVVDKYYGTALQSAARYGYGDIVRLLLEHGADVNAAGEKYGNALAAASAQGHQGIVELLREHGAHEGQSDGKPQ